MFLAVSEAAWCNVSGSNVALKATSQNALLSYFLMFCCSPLFIPDLF